jgi:hypothetical protein
MTVSSPPSRPEPDGGETGSGNGRSPPPPSSSNENSNTNNTGNSQVQSTVECTTLPGNIRKQSPNASTVPADAQQEQIETVAKSDSANSEAVTGNDTSGKTLFRYTRTLFASVIPV